MKTTGLPLTLSLKQFVENKLGELAKYVRKFGTEVELWVEIAKTTAHHRSGPVWRAEADLRLPKKILRAESLKNNLYQAINEIRKELFGQIKKYRGTRESIRKARSK